MKREQIEQAAREYCRQICEECGSRDKCDRSELGKCLPTENEYDAYIAGAESCQPKVTKWKDVDVERPNNGDKVLVRYKTPKHIVWKVTTALYVDSHGQKGFIMPGASKFITHWLPMPEL
jgi:hypothetical protein